VTLDGTATDLPQSAGPRSLMRSQSASWVDFARCRGSFDLFFDPPGEPPNMRRRRVAAAKALCAECPVQMLCREAATQRRENGIWGGETEEERTRRGFMPLGSRSRAVEAARRAWMAEQRERAAS
jgi:WhiB family redox-sensing transcriptional regulator